MEVKLIQVIETSAGLYGLDKDGNVWVYQGHNHGWSKLNMKAMTKRQVTAKFEEEY